MSDSRDHRLKFHRSIDKFSLSQIYEVQCCLQDVYIQTVTCSLWAWRTNCCWTTSYPTYILPSMADLFSFLWRNPYMRLSLFSLISTKSTQQKTFLCIVDFTESLEQWRGIDTIAIQKNLTEYLIPLTLKSFVHFPNRKISLLLLSCPTPPGLQFPHHKKLIKIFSSKKMHNSS